MQFFAKLGKFTFYIEIFLLIGNVPGQLGIFSANWEKIWYRKPDPVLYREKALALNHSIISPLCLVWVRAPLWPHVRQAKFSLRVCQVVFLGVLPFLPHLLIGPSHMS